MNLQQLKYIVEIEKQGSISKAAQALFLSQPSLSNAIRDLEAEIGVTIFLRNKKGISLTPEGRSVMETARLILFQVEQLSLASTQKNKATFRLSTENYSYSMRAYIKMCTLYDSVNHVNFTIKNENLSSTIESISNFSSDLGVLLINSSSYESCLSLLHSKNIEFNPMHRFTVNVNLRSNHPLLQEKPFPFERLKDYLFVRYGSERDNEMSYMPELKLLRIINPNKIVSVFDRDLKCSIISETNAFGIGCTLHPHFLSHFNIAAVPIPDNYATLGYIKLKNSILSSEAQTFIRLLSEEISQHDQADSVPYTASHLHTQ